MIEFFAPMKRPPTVTGSNGKRVDKRSGRIYDAPELSRAREAIESAIAQYRPLEPLSGPLSIEVRWCYPLKRGHRQGEPYTQKPDIDNSCKALFDALQKLGFISDDKLIVEEHVYQAWSEPPGVYILIEQVDC